MRIFLAYQYFRITTLCHDKALQENEEAQSVCSCLGNEREEKKQDMACA